MSRGFGLLLLLGGSVLLLDNTSESKLGASPGLNTLLLLIGSGLLLASGEERNRRNPSRTP
jgi:hypothetical protein